MSKSSDAGPSLNVGPQSPDPQKSPAGPEGRGGSLTRDARAAATTGPDADKTMKGIYKLEKGVLTICLNHNGDRPKDFDEKGDGIGTIVMEKKEPEKKEEK